MDSLTHHHVVVLFLSLGILLATSRILGELFQKLHQPAVLGELLAGVLLGPTVLGSIAPNISEYLFPADGYNAIALDTIVTLSICMFLMVAGIEVNLSTIWKQGKLGLKIGVASMVIPFLFGITAGWFFPQQFGGHPEADPLIFSLFLAVALSITALPVIAKTLMDMDLYRSDLGMVVISAAILNDLAGWIVFAVVLSLIEDHSTVSNYIPLIIGLTLLFTGSMLTVGRWLIHKILPFIQAYTRWPAGELSFAIILAFFGAALTEKIGIHAIFGAFIIGVAVGDSSHLRERTRVIIEQFVSSIFAPIFFASIGLKVNFFAHFDIKLVASVMTIACICKFAGGVFGGLWGGMKYRDAWAVGFAMNSRGAMEIVLGMLALEAGIIRPRLFVALVIMAIVTSIISGPGMRWVLKLSKKRKLQDYIFPKNFLRNIDADSKWEVIKEMTAIICESQEMDATQIEKFVREREEAMSTGIGNGVAIPHARIKGLKSPMIAVGISDKGIDFDAPDGMLAHVIFYILTPDDNSGAQLELGSEIARLFRHPTMVNRVLRTESFTDFLALIKHASIQLESS